MANKFLTVKLKILQLGSNSSLFSRVKSFPSGCSGQNEDIVHLRSLWSSKLSYVPGGKITFRSRLSLSRFFSVSRPLTLLPEAVVISWGLGIGILMGRPAFLWRIDSSNNDFSCTSDSLDFECRSLKEKMRIKRW